MADLPWEHADEARAALNAIVTDPEHGIAALSSPRTMSNLLKDLLPDAPREKNLLVAAAEAGLADSLKEHVSQGMDSSTAISLTASSFSARSPLTPDACRWVTGEIAVALGISETNDAAPSAQPPGGGSLGAAATEASPGYDSHPPGQRAPAERQPAPDSFGSGQDSYSRVRDSAPPTAGSYPGASAVISPGQGPGSEGPAGSAGSASSYPPPGYEQSPASQPPGQGGYQPGQGGGYQSGQDSYQPAADYSPPGAGYAPGYSPAAAGYSAGAPGYTPPTAFSPAENPQAYGPGVAAGMPAMTGAAYQPTPRPGISRRTNTMAVTSLVLGITQSVGWIIFLLPGLLAAILAVVLGFVSIKQISRSGEAGRGLAITGVILGFVGILVVGILVVVVGVASVNSQSTP